MPRFHFHIVEDGRVITDEEGQELTARDAVRREAVETGASVARDAFMQGSASQGIVDVRKGDELFLKSVHFPHSRGVKRTSGPALLHELYRDHFSGRRGRPRVMAPHASKQPGSPAYSAPSIVARSIAAGILATDMSERATWLKS